MHQSDSIVIIPTYNEKENIEKIIRAITGLEKCFHILIIDDGSPDGTAAIVKGLMALPDFSDRLFLLERSGKLGLGTAYIMGFKWALEQTTNTSSRWMPTSATTPTTCRASTVPVPTKATMWPSVQDMSRVSMSSTGQSVAC